MPIDTVDPISVDFYSDIAKRKHKSALPQLSCAEHARRRGAVYRRRKGLVWEGFAPGGLGTGGHCKFP